MHLSLATWSLATWSLAAALLATPVFANSPRIPADSPDRVFGYDAQVPACDNDSVIGEITARFNDRERREWNSSLAITGFDQPKETHFRPNGADLIPRRYCTARVLLSDNKYRAVTYNIVEDQGATGWHGSLFFGLVRFPTSASFSVEWCISGLDRSRVHAQDCRMARP